MSKFLEKLFYIFLGMTVFLIPWQMRWIFFDQSLNGQLWEYGRLSIYLSWLFLVLAIVCFFVYTKTNHSLKPDISKGQFTKMRSWLLLAFPVYLFITVWFSYLPIVSLYYLSLIIFAFLFSYLLTQVNNKFFLWILVTSGLVQGLMAFYQFISQYILANKWLGMAQHWPQVVGTSVIQTEGGRWLRAYGSLPHPNILGGFLVICILAAIYLWFLVYTEASQEHWSKIKTWQKAKKFIIQLSFLLVSLVVMTFGLLASFSRGAMMALVVSVLVGIVFEIIKKNKLKIIVLVKYLFILLLTILTFNILLPNSLWSRWQFSSRLENKSVTERVDSWQQIDWRDPQAILFGQGLGLNTAMNYHGGASYEVQPIHNYWLLVLAEIGLIGLLLWLLFFWDLLRVRIFDLGHLWLLAWLVAGLFDHYWWTSWTGWLILALILARFNSQNAKSNI